MLKTRVKRNVVVLNRRSDEILRTIYFYRYMTALDVSHLLYSPGSLTTVRSVLSSLAGGGDFENNEYLYRFRLPSVRSGNSERVYTLGSRGRDYLRGELGLAVDWHFRPDKIKHLGHGQVIHNLVLTRFLVAAHVWARSRVDFKLVEARICYELAQVPVVAEGRKVWNAVIPDGWLLFEKTRGDAHDCWLPVLLEIDRGTQDSRKFKERLEARIEFIRSGEYKKLFAQEAVRIAYATTGETPEYRETRRRAMCAWTKEVLVKTHREKWGSVFRFCSLCLEEIYKSHLFEESVWYRPDQDKPMGLFMT